MVLICQICGTSFALKDNLTKHIQMKHEPRIEIKDKICRYCGKGYARQQQLKRHELAHRGERNFVCEVRYSNKYFIKSFIFI